MRGQSYCTDHFTKLEVLAVAFRIYGSSYETRNRMGQRYIPSYLAIYICIYMYACARICIRMQACMCVFAHKEKRGMAPLHRVHMCVYVYMAPLHLEREYNMV